MTLGYFRPLAGFELSKVRIKSPPKVEIQANLDFGSKNSIQSFGLGLSGFHEMWKHWNRVLFILLCFIPVDWICREMHSQEITRVLDTLIVPQMGDRLR